MISSRAFGRPGMATCLAMSAEAQEYVRAYRTGNWSMPWLNAYAEGMFESEIAKVFEVTGIPKPILVDPQGTIVEVGMGLRGETLIAVLARYIGE
jgi:triphosphoribosyl-dephospho-CoA synthetase